MRILPSEVPDKIKRLMSPQDRKSLGDFAETTQEIQERVEAKSEKVLHDQIVCLLGRSGVKFFGHGRMDKPSAYTVGWPDFVIPLPNGTTLYWEVKNGIKPPRKEQVECLQYLHESGHKAALIQYYSDAVNILNENLRADR